MHHLTSHVRKQGVQQNLVDHVLSRPSKDITIETEEIYDVPIKLEWSEVRGGLESFSISLSLALDYAKVSIPLKPLVQLSWGWKI